MSEAARVPDIIPPHYPESLALEALRRAEGAKAMAVVIIDENGREWCDICGHDKHAVLWALEYMKARMMGLTE